MQFAGLPPWGFLVDGMEVALRGIGVYPPTPAEFCNE